MLDSIAPTDTNTDAPEGGEAAETSDATAITAVVVAVFGVMVAAAGF